MSGTVVVATHRFVAEYLTLVLSTPGYIYEYLSERSEEKREAGLIGELIGYMKSDQHACAADDTITILERFPVYDRLPDQSVFRDKELIGDAITLQAAACAARVVAVEYDGNPPKGPNYAVDDMLAAGVKLVAYRVINEGRLRM